MLDLLLSFFYRWFNTKCTRSTDDDSVSFATDLLAVLGISNRIGVAGALAFVIARALC